MKTWHDHALLLDVKRHSESACIASVLSKHHGLYTGFVHGGRSKKRMSTWQAGTLLTLTWRARLDSHMGFFTHTPEYGAPTPPQLTLYNHPQALACFASALTFARQHAQPRQKESALYHSLCALRRQLHASHPSQNDSMRVAQRYACWEYDFLAMMGYGLDLRDCASGTPCHARDLIYVSPKSGHAVSADKGRAWARKLLPLPPFLCHYAHHRTLSPQPSRQDIFDALNMSGYFLEKHLCHRHPLPYQRRLILFDIARCPQPKSASPSSTRDNQEISEHAHKIT
ncbi:MAG: recombination protein O N-terminal domain-containing protein [Alphaproteobacteria bacterium GM7ARS4]|nr:recombination protein O N-terminal domain-containing protein [Alphaproteobacteria bacterium GM7ARS4]